MNKLCPLIIILLLLLLGRKCSAFSSVIGTPSTHLQRAEQYNSMGESLRVTIVLTNQIFTLKVVTNFMTSSVGNIKLVASATDSYLLATAGLCWICVAGGLAGCA